MKFGMHRNSLFAVLMRSPWWASLAVAVAIVLVARLLVPLQYLPYIAFGAAPFAVISAIVAWRTLRAPSPARVEATLQALRGLSWPEFAAVLETAFGRDGQAVTRLDGRPADLELVKGWRTTLVGARRWKAARHGVEPLRELDAARQAREAHDCIYIALGELTDQARRFAADHRIRLMQADDIAQWLSRTQAIKVVNGGVSRASR